MGAHSAMLCRVRASAYGKRGQQRLAFFALILVTQLNKAPLPLNAIELPNYIRI